MQHRTNQKKMSKARTEKIEDLILFSIFFPLCTFLTAMGGVAYYCESESPVFTGLSLILFMNATVIFVCSVIGTHLTIRKITGMCYELSLYDDGTIEMETKRFLFWKGHRVVFNIKESELKIEGFTKKTKNNVGLCYKLKTEGRYYYILYDAFSDIPEINYWLLSRKPNYKVFMYKFKTIVQNLYKEYEASIK